MQAHPPGADVPVTSPAGRQRAALERYAVLGVTTLAVTGAVAVVAVVDPGEPGHYPTCPFLAVTGHYCPGCGSLRAVHALTRGDVGEALARNPLLVASIPVLLVLGVLWLRRTATGREPARAAPAWLIWGVLGLLVAFGVARNLPGADWLAP